MKKYQRVVRLSKQLNVTLRQLTKRSGKTPKNMEWLWAAEHAYTDAGAKLTRILQEVLKILEVYIKQDEQTINTIDGLNCMRKELLAATASVIRPDFLKGSINSIFP